MLAEKVQKYFGHEGDLIHCEVDGCLEIMDSKALKELDEKGIIMWARAAKDSKVVFPLCPQHGVVMRFAVDSISNDSGSYIM